MRVLAAPVLGALSDKYGRRPLLLICLFGSAIGYLVFGIGGALWVLFAGRIIEGITGGSISTIFAYFADIIPKEQRTKILLMGECSCRCGNYHWPHYWGLLAKFGDTVPMYFGAIITLINVVYGIKYMPESLDKNNRLKEITFVRLNPFAQLANILSMKNLKWLLVSAFLLWIPNGSLQSNFHAIYNGYFQLETCTNRTYVFNFGLSRHCFTKFYNAKAFDPAVINK